MSIDKRRTDVPQINVSRKNAIRSLRFGMKDQLVLWNQANWSIHGIWHHQSERVCWQKVNQLSVAHINTLVGRTIVAIAAKRRALRRNVDSSTLPWPILSPSRRILRPSLSVWESSFSCAGKDQWNGQLYKAMTVRVVSKQLENVRVAQNHCQGLRAVNARAAQASLLSWP